MTTSNFTTELDQLIRQHLGTPRFGDEFGPLVAALQAAACRLAEAADTFPWRDELEQEFRERGRPC
jgi:hypothetical protein